jgi:uncharacterized protein YraI
VVAIPAAPTPGSQRTLPPGVVAVPAAPASNVTPGPAGPAAPVIVTPAPVPAATPAPAATQQAAPVAPQLPPGTWIGSITGDKVNARGRATVHSHAVFSFNMNEPVLVLGEVTLSTPKAGDLRKWLRVQVPENVGLFVHKNYVINIRPMQVPGPNGQPLNIKVGEVKTKTSRLNVRAGAGERFPKLGSIPKGASVILTDRPAQGDWLEIVAPETTEVFVAAKYVAKHQGQKNPGTPRATPGVAISKPVVVPDPTSARFIPGTGQPGAVPTPPRPERPKPVEIISIPIGALGQSQPGANDPNEAFPAPPIPVKRSRPTVPKKGSVQPKQPSGAGKESGKIISNPGVAKPTPTSNPEPEVNAKPTPEKVEVKEAKPPTPAVPTPPVKPKENSKPPQPDGSAKPKENSKVKPSKTPKPVEVAKVKPNESTKLTETAKPTEQNKVAAKPVKPGTKPGDAPPKLEEKKPVRIVTREGYVQRTLNIQSPTPYVLEHLVNGKVINYLHLDHPKLPLKLLRGRRVLITGEEAIDPRWLDTPVLKIQTLKTIDDTEISQGK